MDIEYYGYISMVNRFSDWKLLWLYHYQIEKNQVCG